MSSEDPNERHEAVYIKCAELSYLPGDLTLEDGTVAVVDYCKVGELAAAYEILNDCRERKDNVALTEYDDYEDWLDSILYKWMFIIKINGKLVGVFSLGPYHCSRSLLPGSAEIYLYLRKEVSKAAFVPVFTLAEKFALDLNCGYFSITYHVFYTNFETVMLLKKLNYTISAIIPHSGIVPGKGLVETMVMTKNIAPILPMTRWGEALQKMDEMGYNDPERIAEFDKTAEWPAVPGFPQAYTSQNGTVVTLRNLEVRDHRWLYDLMNASVERGDGYTIDDFGVYQYFRETALIRGHVVVIELPGKGQVAAVMMMPSGYYRGTENHLLDTNIIVDPKFKGLGIGKDLTDLWLTLGKELKYKAVLTSIILTNHRTFTIVRSRNLAYCGTIPATGNMKGLGWTDGCLCYKDLSEILTFTELKAIREAEAENKKKASKL